MRFRAQGKIQKFPKRSKIEKMEVWTGKMLARLVGLHGMKRNESEMPLCMSAKQADANKS